MKTHFQKMAPESVVNFVKVGTNQFSADSESYKHFKKLTGKGAGEVTLEDLEALGCLGIYVQVNGNDFLSPARAETL